MSDYCKRCRALEKEVSRLTDALDLATGIKTREQLKTENGAFAFPRHMVRLYAPGPKTMAVTFDVGYTLVELDTDEMASRLGSRGIRVYREYLDDRVSVMRQEYEECLIEGKDHETAWRCSVAGMLCGVIDDDDFRVLVGNYGTGPAIDWLWSSQRDSNMWRRPIHGMRELVEEVRSQGYSVGIISNSEGHIAALVQSMGWSRLFDVIVDSGVEGVRKPDPAIFRLALERLGVSDPRYAVHVGDSVPLDVEGARAAGLRAVHVQGGAEVVRTRLVEAGVLPLFSHRGSGDPTKDGHGPDHSVVSRVTGDTGEPHGDG